MLGMTGFDNREIVFLNGRLSLKIADDARNGREILRFSRTKDRAGRPHAPWPQIRSFRPEVAVDRDRCALRNLAGTVAGAAASDAELLAAVPAELLPGIVKTARLGYDGKGQIRVKTREELAAAWEQLGRVPCVLEKLMPLQSECSVLVARGADGQVVSFPVQANTHHDGILAITEVYEGAVPADLAARAQASTVAIANHLNYIGVLCVEYFVVDNGQGGADLIVNEMAPRPHNSGHYTQNACDISQFEAQVRALAGLPLPVPRQHSPAIMVNLLGDLWFNPNGVRAQASERPVSPPWAQVLALPGTHLHLYGKLSARPGRKMGHLNITGSSVAQVRETTAKVLALLGLPALP